ncbi:tyrosine-type recombinase/integrase [Lysobacter sp. LF1]|uniref:Tyrosine-type recombinase/integrase n=1 Tax=Lysobacter stagni TaxID=3045172 RepID=A0ABT6XH03_9GAMM|nr:tyrosine-type recombinase/integrase [Lysobacter sp. LF1]MDI9239442.1 tyrosine-type recombinase/integrase [Lysobacter sp. LF1]
MQINACGDYLDLTPQFCHSQEELMATFRKRGPYQWEAQIRRRGYPATSKTFETKAEAEAWSAMIESEMSRGVWVSRSQAESTTLHQLLERYEREVVPTKKGHTQERSVLSVWRSTALARRTVAGVRSTDVAALRDEWLRSYKAATVLRRLSVLSHVFNVARREWGMESVGNPVELVRKPTVNNARSRRLAAIAEAGSNTLAKGELDRVIASTESTTLPAIVRLAVETAMRRSEIVGLRWEHIDLTRRVAHLPATKNGSSRNVPLSGAAVEVLANLLPTGAQVNRAPGGRVFHLRDDAVTRAFERAVARARHEYESECRMAGLPADATFLTNLRFHDLRHEATSRLADVYQLHELSKVTGHKDPRMLLRYYHPSAEDLARRLL